MTAADPLVFLEAYSTDAEAHIVAGMLESNGIPCIIDNQVFGPSVFPIGFNSIGALRLMVPASYEAQARALLREHDDG